MWPTDRLQRRIGIEHPIVQAPMAGASTTAMAAAVSNAGGLGSLGCATMTPDELRGAARDVAAATNLPVNFNFFVHAEPDLATYDAAPMQAGAVLIGSATSVAEALALEAGGMDAVVAQGAEAGGHRGSFIGDPAGNDMGTMALVPQIADAVSAPVIAAGGLFDGRGVAAAFMLGASGAQIGTAFLRTPESAVSPAHKSALAQTPDGETRLTRAFTGRPARSIRNRLSEALATIEGSAAPFPLQRHWTAPLASAAAARGGLSDFQPLWSGQAGPRALEAPAADIFRAICEDALALLA